MLLATRASEDHLESTLLMVTLDLPDLPNLRDIMVLRAMQDRLQYLVFRVFVDHLGSMVPRVNLDPGPVPVFLRL